MSKIHIMQRCIKPPKFFFLSPPPHFENYFFIPVTTFSRGAVGYNIWWQLLDTTFGGSCGIQILKKNKEYKKIIQKITARLGTPKTIFLSSTHQNHFLNGGFIHPCIIANLHNAVFSHTRTPKQMNKLS